MAYQTQGNADDWIIPIELMLGSIDHNEVQACSISTVLDEVRNPKEEAYRPKVVSIGPIHKGTSGNLQLMEELKWRYTLSLLGRTGMQENVLRSSATTVLDLDYLVRASYGGSTELEPHDLAKVMLVDGCFVLEFLLRLEQFYCCKSSSQDFGFKDDPIFVNRDKLSSVLNDLMLLENQIPFVVLKKLYRKIFPASDIAIQNDHRVAHHALDAFGYRRVDRSGIAHLLHLIHLSNVDPDNRQSKKAGKELKRCATRLLAAGITIQPANSSNPEDNNFVDKFDFDIKFQDGKLEIPALHIKERTEVIWRNLIAWEQGRIGIICKFTSYALFFQALICCEHDIKQLLKNKVIVNDSGKNMEDLLTLFGTITEGVEHMDSSYSELCESLNKYQSEKVLKKLTIITWHQCRFVFAVIRYYWKNWYNILIRDHIPTVWKLIGVLGAMLLLALTFMQTYYAARSQK